MEGIMMRGPKRTAMAVRNTKGELVIEEWNTVSKKPAKIWTLPLFRGLYGMYSSMKVGYQALMRSAVLSGLDELEEMEENEKRLKKLNKKRKKEGLPPLEELPEEERAEHTPSDAFSFMKEEQSDTATKEGAPEETACTDEAVCTGEEATLQEAEVSVEKTETETTGAQPAEETEKKELKKEKEEKEKGLFVQ